MSDDQFIAQCCPIKDEFTAIEGIMPTATLTYTLPEENDDFVAAIDGAKWKSVVWDFDQQILRPVVRYGQDQIEADHYQKIRNELFKLIEEHGVEL